MMVSKWRIFVVMCMMKADDAENLHQPNYLLRSHYNVPNNRSIGGLFVTVLLPGCEIRELQVKLAKVGSETYYSRSTMPLEYSLQHLLRTRISACPAR